MTDAPGSAGADTAADVADKRMERPRLIRKRLITKEDGRYLIFYEFDGDQPEVNPQSEHKCHDFPRQTGQQQ